MSARLTVAAAIGEGARRLAASGIAEARREAGLLVGHALGCPREALLLEPDRALDAEARARLTAALERRARREPMAHVLGRRAFWTLTLAVTPSVLDPRPDSETVVEAALAGVRDRAAPLSVLDLGTGSGCLLLALLSELPNGWGLGVDKSAAALAVARRNAAACGLGGRARFLAGDWADALAGAFDLVVANPPYVARGDLGGLAPEVALHEPRLALDGGLDGLDAYRALAPALPRLLAPAGRACLELGAGQADAVASLLAAAGLEASAARSDLAGIPRCIVAARRVNKKIVGFRDDPD